MWNGDGGKPSPVESVEWCRGTSTASKKRLALGLIYNGVDIYTKVGCCGELSKATPSSRRAIPKVTAEYRIKTKKVYLYVCVEVM